MKRQSPLRQTYERDGVISFKDTPEFRFLRYFFTVPTLAV
jgi:hypothetical protein